MKRLISILFLVVFLFNIGGYYLVFQGMEMKAKKELLSRLDADAYSDDEVVVLSIPFTLPYPVNEGTFERIDGDFQHHGKHYKLVKQKLENDTLFVVCIHDREATKIANVLSDYSKVANNIPAGSKQALSFLSKIYKDYNTTEFKIFYKSRFLFDRIYYAHNAPPLIGMSPGVDCPPPENRS